MFKLGFLSRCIKGPNKDLTRWKCLGTVYNKEKFIALLMFDRHLLRTRYHPNNFPIETLIATSYWLWEAGTEARSFRTQVETRAQSCKTMSTPGILRQWTGSQLSRTHPECFYIWVLQLSFLKSQVPAGAGRGVACDWLPSSVVSPLCWGRVGRTVGTDK